MRELKFRIWDKAGKYFITPESNFQSHYTLTLNGEFHNLQNGVGGDEVVVQQFTGLKDKNGREIYEGDLVNRDFTLGTIFFHDGSFKWVGRQVNKALWHLSCPIMPSIQEYSIVGNIFENSDLLECK